MIGHSYSHVMKDIERREKIMVLTRYEFQNYSGMSLLIIYRHGSKSKILEMKLIKNVKN